MWRHICYVDQIQKLCWERSDEVNNNNNNSRISIPPSVVTSEALPYSCNSEVLLLTCWLLYRRFRKETWSSCFQCRTWHRCLTVRVRKSPHHRPLTQLRLRVFSIIAVLVRQLVRCHSSRLWLMMTAVVQMHRGRSVRGDTAVLMTFSQPTPFSGTRYCYWVTVHHWCCCRKHLLVCFASVTVYHLLTENSRPAANFW